MTPGGEALPAGFISTEQYIAQQMQAATRDIAPATTVPMMPYYPYGGYAENMPFDPMGFPAGQAPQGMPIMGSVMGAMPGAMPYASYPMTQ